jgi:hypothetical protein
MDLQQRRGISTQSSEVAGRDNESDRLSWSGWRLFGVSTGLIETLETKTVCDLCSQRFARPYRRPRAHLAPAAAHSHLKRDQHPSTVRTSEASPTRRRPGRIGSSYRKARFTTVTQRRVGNTLEKADVVNSASAAYLDLQQIRPYTGDTSKV